MSESRPVFSGWGKWRGRRLWVAAWLGVAALALGADPPTPSKPPEKLPAPTELPRPPDPPREVLSRDEAVRRALLYNPEIAAFRRQRGVAAAGVVIAETYPFNPIVSARVQQNNGPESAGITTRIAMEHSVTLDVEVRGQKSYRRQGALSTLSRTEAEIAFQEVDLGVRVARAFDTLLYRWRKVELAEEFVRLNRDGAEKVRKLVAGGELRGADLILAQSEVNDVLGQLSPARSALAVAQAALNRTLGFADLPPFDVTGSLDAPPLPAGYEELVRVARERRADLRAHQAAVAEAEAHLRLEVANRYGNPSIGPIYSYDPTRVNLIGGQISLPLPVFNTHRGEILQREAERDRAVLELRNVEAVVALDVQAAVVRFEAARSWVNAYRTRIIPGLQTGLEGIEKLFAKNEPGVDVLRVLDVRRKLLRARDAYLDALFEMRQALADLAFAIGDVSLVAPCTPSEAPRAIPPAMPPADPPPL
jgi:cobalt-zinc-cadmium efflux system outer membrane protein